MTMMKRIAAMMAVVMVMAMTMVVPASALTGVSACTSITGDTSEACQIAKAIGEGREYSDTKDTANGYSYDIMVTINGQSVKLWLKTRPDISDFRVQMDDDGALNVGGLGSGDANQWNNLFNKYRTVVVGISGVGAITMVVFFIINFMRLGASTNNPQARSQALTGILWTGFAAAGLGAVSIVSGFFYNAL